MPSFPPPVELPTKRQSRMYNHHEPDIHDPNYIPVLNGAAVQLDFSHSPFSPIPTVPTKHGERIELPLTRSKSSLAPERVPPPDYESDPESAQYVSVKERYTKSREPLSSTREKVSSPLERYPSPPQQTEPHELASPTRPPSEDGQNIQEFEDNTPSTARSSGGSMTSPQLMENQVFTIPGNATPKVEEITFPTVLASSRSSIASIRKSGVPTSRYNRKALPSVPAIPSSRSSMAAETPTTASPQTNPPTPVAATFSLPNLPLAKTPPPAEPLSIQPTPKLEPMKSSASTSDRRQRALTSHPSNPSLRSRRNSAADEKNDPQQSQSQQPLPPPPLQLTPQHPLPVVFPERRPGSSRSRSESMCKLPQPTPAPSTPLPDLPNHAKKSSMSQRDRFSPYVASPNSSPPSRLNDHTELADFMTVNKTIVFRRFDEVHVRLLLQLQDEIALLEKELLDLENVGTTKSEKVHRRVTVMHELRKLLAEYDHLFANWSQMQTNKTSPHTREQLEKWLRNPASGSGAISKSAQDDISWLQNSKDLSTVSLVPHNDSHPDRNEKGNRAAGGGGFAAFFGCGRRRK